MANYTAEQYKALCAALAGGELEVEYDGKRVRYRSLDEMIRIKNMMERDMRSGAGVMGTRIIPVHSKGL